MAEAGRTPAVGQPGPVLGDIGGGAALAGVLERFGLPRSPVLVLVGGASQLDDEELARLRPYFTEVLAPLAGALGACVVDGGTDVGVMRLMGRARADLGGTFPLVGVVPKAKIPPSTATDAAPAEPHHTHLVLVPGNEWGDESPVLAEVASQLAGDQPSVTILVNGGAVSLDDAAHSVRVGRPVLVLEGSGRTADAVGAALRTAPADEQLRTLAASGLVEAVPLADGPPAFARAVARLLAAPERPPAVGKLYEDWLEAEFGTMIDELPLSRLQRRYLRSRWLDQLDWMESRAKPAQRRYYLLRLATIVGGVLVPAMVALRLGGTPGTAVTVTTWVVSLLVAFSAAAEEFFRFGDRWRHYRQTAEQLKIEGWEFSQLTGNYGTFTTHTDAHRQFAARVENLIRKDVEGFISTVAQEPAGPSAGGQGGAPGPAV